ncbi:MAG: hypothetical protein HY692_00600 [Cyanobacteria bacterium NC_groundwater_1444_Ag_S-0.65um_54_12]|nr:hypothetical protein [Cyanobacteria bacterium NC_groundwater_1444_Ag_S-0.65um_54_12]
MDTHVKCDETQIQLKELEGQLRMFAKIKELYNIDFSLEVRKIEKRVEQLWQVATFRESVQQAM